MTLAERVKQTITTKCPQTFSLYAGYGLEGGQPVHFPGGLQQAERRNKLGRCTHAEYRYADNSVLIYRYNETSGYTLTTQPTTRSKP